MSNYGMNIYDKQKRVQQSAKYPIFGFNSRLSHKFKTYTIQGVSTAPTPPNPFPDEPPFPTEDVGGIEFNTKEYPNRILLLKVPHGEKKRPAFLAWIEATNSDPSVYPGFFPGFGQVATDDSLFVEVSYFIKYQEYRQYLGTYSERNITAEADDEFIYVYWDEPYILFKVQSFYWNGSVGSDMDYGYQYDRLVYIPSLIGWKINVTLMITPYSESGEELRYL